MRRLALPSIPLFLVMLLSAGAAVGDAPTYEDYEKAVGEALKAEDDAARTRAFDVLHECTDARAVDLIIKSAKVVKGEQERIRRDQATIEEQYEKEFSRKVKVDRWFANSNRSGKDTDRYNKEVKKIRKKLDNLRIKQRNLENDFTTARAQLDSAVRAMSKVLAIIPAEDLAGALEKVQVHWRGSKATELKMWWLDALADVDRLLAQEQVRSAVKDPELPAVIRAAALETLGSNRAAGAFVMAFPYLKARSEWDMTAAAVQVMRLLHEKRCVEPLITFLQREDIKRLRDDAHAALLSLTGQKHGPYHDPWKSWWDDHGDTFQMPKKPVTSKDGQEQPEGVTFYGIHTFSDRILFILDVSGSMDQAPKSGPDEGPKPPKIEVAQKELIGAIESLNPGDRFNVIFFNHEVVQWQGKMAEATNSTMRRAKKWILDQEPQGGTNIHDALEKGFGLALRATGEPVLDTVYFLTDGKPTAGKIQIPEKILALVEEWNRSARLTIHCVGVGKHDQEFMQALANIGKGTYVKR